MSSSSRSTLKRLSLLGPLAVAAALGIGTLPAQAQSTAASDCSAIHFSISNPYAGARVEQGGLTLQGSAMDSRAASGVGIDVVQFSLDSRDLGGPSIGTAYPGWINAMPKQPGEMASPMGPASFQTTITLPDNFGGHDLFAYAHSTVTGQESIIDIPFSLGEDSAAPIPSAPITTMVSCSGGGGMSTPMPAPGSMLPVPAPVMAAPMAAPMAAMTPVTPAITALLPGSSLVFSVSNPSAGDSIKAGGLMIEGWAFDRAALPAQGTGVDSIAIFLDSRDSGGVFLGHAVPIFGTSKWQATLMLPNKPAAHWLYFDAHSSVTGSDTILTIPVTLIP